MANSIPHRRGGNDNSLSQAVDDTLCPHVHLCTLYAPAAERSRLPAGQNCPKRKGVKWLTPLMYLGRNVPPEKINQTRKVRGYTGRLEKSQAAQKMISTLRKLPLDRGPGHIDNVRHLNDPSSTLSSGAYHCKRLPMRKDFKSLVPISAHQCATIYSTHSWTRCVHCPCDQVIT